MKTRRLGILIALGMGLLMATLSATASPKTIASVVTSIDNFDSDSLNSRWSWVRQDVTHWSLTTQPGSLRIVSQQGRINDSTNKNMLVQTAPVGNFEIQTRLVFTPTENIQRAGLLVYQDDTNYFLLARAYCGFTPPCVGNGIYFDQVEQAQFIGSNFAVTTTLSGDAYLRLIRQGTIYTGYVSMNGADWSLIGTHTVISGLVPSKIGFMVDDANFGAPEISADFDFFLLNDGSERLFLPLVQK